MHAYKESKKQGKARNKSMKQVEKSSEVHFHCEGRSVERRNGWFKAHVPTVLPCLPWNGWKPRQRSKVTSGNPHIALRHGQKVTVARATKLEQSSTVLDNILSSPPKRYASVRLSARRPRLQMSKTSAQDERPVGASAP